MLLIMLSGLPKFTATTKVIKMAGTPKQGSQPNHFVTNNNNHTKPASKMESAKRPAVGADVDAKKKYGSKSWNNGYTN
mgnify:CR=1 FL=1